MFSTKTLSPKICLNLALNPALNFFAALNPLFAAREALSLLQKKIVKKNVRKTSKNRPPLQSEIGPVRLVIRDPGSGVRDEAYSQKQPYFGAVLTSHKTRC